MSLRKTAITCCVVYETLRTHYLHGEPPFKWSDYRAWMSSFQSR